MRASIPLLISFLLPLASSATITPGLKLFPNATTFSTALEGPFNASRPSAPEPYSETVEDVIVVLSRYGRPVDFVSFVGMYVGCLWKIWKVVAHSRNAYQPPETRPLDEHWFTYQNDLYYLEWGEHASAVVAWKYVELYYTLNVIVSFAAKYGMREMDVEVVTAGTGSFGGTIRHIAPPEASQWVEHFG